MIYKVNGNSSYQLTIDGSTNGIYHYSGSDYILVDAAGSDESSVKFSFAAGNLFTINSIQVANYQTAFAAQTIVFQGYDASNNKVGSAQNFTLGVRATGQWDVNCSFTGFTDISYLVMKADPSSNSGLLHNLTLDTISLSNIKGIVSSPTTTVTSALMSDDTGSSSTDFVTNTASQRISGTLSANLASGEFVEVSFDNGSTWSNATSYTTGSSAWYTDEAMSGSSTFKARVSNSGGSSTAYSQSYTIDITAPTTTVSTLSLSADTGSSSTDFITKTAAQTISGTLSANVASGETVEVSTDNGMGDSDSGGRSVWLSYAERQQQYQSKGG